MRFSAFSEAMPPLPPDTGFHTSCSLTPPLCSSSSLPLLTSACQSLWSPPGPPIHKPEHFLCCEHPLPHRGNLLLPLLYVSFHTLNNLVSLPCSCVLSDFLQPWLNLIFLVLCLLQFCTPSSKKRLEETENKNGFISILWPQLWQILHCPSPFVGLFAGAWMQHFHSSLGTFSFNATSHWFLTLHMASPHPPPLHSDHTYISLPLRGLPWSPSLM